MTAGSAIPGFDCILRDRHGCIRAPPALPSIRCPELVVVRDAADPRADLVVMRHDADPRAELVVAPDDADPRAELVVMRRARMYPRLAPLRAIEFRSAGYIRAWPRY